MLVQLSKYYKLSSEQLSTTKVKAYLYYCKEKRGLSNPFINQTISALKVLRQDVLDLPLDDGLKIKRPRKDQRLPAILSSQQIHALIDVTGTPKHKAVIVLLYSSGIRIDELINLRLDDIDSTRMRIRIEHGKGKNPEIPY